MQPVQCFGLLSSAISRQPSSADLCCDVLDDGSLLLGRAPLGSADGAGVSPASSPLHVRIQRLLRVVDAAAGVEAQTCSHAVRVAVNPETSADASADVRLLTGTRRPEHNTRHISSHGARAELSGVNGKVGLHTVASSRIQLLYFRLKV